MLVLVLLVVLCCLHTIRARQTRRKPTEPPVLPEAKLFFGHFPLDCLNSAGVWKVLERASERCQDAGGVACLLLGPKTLYVITDPEDSATVANTCLQKSDFYEFAKPWLGDGLISADVATWKVHRRLLNPAFSQSVLDGFVGVFNDQSRRLVKELEAKMGTTPFNHWPYLALNGLDTIFLTALGTDINSSIDHEERQTYIKALSEIFNVIITRAGKIWLQNDLVYKWSRMKQAEDKLLEVLHGMSNKVLQHRKLKLNDKNNNINNKKGNLDTKFKPFLDLLLEVASNKDVFSDKQIREHVDTMIVAGHDTSANTLMYALVLLGSYPDCQRKVYEEIQEVLGTTDCDIEKQDLPRLVYTEAVIKETLRLYPIFPLVTRTVDRDVKLKNHTLAAGKTCLLMLYGIHRHPCWGLDAQEFNPDRWLDPATLPDLPHAFAGFSIGRRGCIGKNYAMMSMKTTLAHIIRSYTVTADCSRLKLKLGVMLRPISGHHITIERRH